MASYSCAACSCAACNDFSLSTLKAKASHLRVFVGFGSIQTHAPVEDPPKVDAVAQRKNNMSTPQTVYTCLLLLTSLCLSLSICFFVVHALSRFFLFASLTKRHGGRRCALPPNPPPAFFDIIKSLLLLFHCLCTFLSVSLLPLFFN